MCCRKACRHLTSGHFTEFGAFGTLPYSAIPVSKIIASCIGIISNAFHSLRKTMFILWAFRSSVQSMVHKKNEPLHTVSSAPFKVRFQ